MIVDHVLALFKIIPIYLGMANVLTTFPFQSGDAILVNNRTYGAMKNQVDDIITNRRTGEGNPRLQYHHSWFALDE